MKKILVLFLALLFVSPTWANEYFNNGKNAYNMGLYGEAKEQLGLAVKSKPKNTLYRYYYAQTLMQLGMVEEAAEEYRTITLSSPKSYEGMSAMRALQSIDKYFENQHGQFKLPTEDDGDYVSYLILEHSNLVRWDKDQISVYIQESDSADIAEKAFNIWSSKTGNILKFNYVPSKEIADIVVTYTDKMPIIDTEDGYIKGTAVIKTQDKSITHVDIIIKDVEDNKIDKTDPDTIYATTLHEIGHAIGLRGHSDNPKDIMYQELSALNRTISPRDVNTFKKLYKYDNENLAEIKSKPMSYSIRVRYAKDYAEAYPNLYNAWSELAAAYVASGDYENAITSIQKSIELKGEDPSLYSQLAEYYAKVGKNDLSIETYKHAYDLQPANKVYLYNWAKACYKNKRAEEARATVDSYLMGDGFLANDEISRSLRRMYKQDKEKEKNQIKKNRERKEKKLQEMQEFQGADSIDY